MATSSSGAFDSVADIIAAVRSGRTSPRDVVDAAIQRARAASPLSAFISIADAIPDTMIAAAADGPLAGIPIAVKDNTDAVGFPCTGGTPALRDWRPASDAAAVARLKAAGAIVIGKANLHELAAGMTSNNPTFGPVLNPYDIRLIAGGSSGGSAAAVAAGIVPASLGSDTAGSNRVPASLCGCVGFRPTVGRYPTDGVIPLSLTRDTLGIFAHTIADTQLLDGIVAGRPAVAKKSGLKGRRLGVPRPYFYEALDRKTQDVIEAALGRLSDAGAILVETEVKDIGALVGPITLGLIFYETLRDISVYLARGRCPVRAWEIVDQMASTVERGWLEAEIWGESLPTSTYNDILARGRPAVQQAYRDCFARDDLDALVLPTTAIPARPAGQDETVKLDGRDVPTLATYMRNTDPTSVAGMPSISVPAGLTTSGLPVGLMFDGLAGSDGDLLDIAAGFQALAPRLPRPAQHY
ncbi:MAG: indole acetimide hydrolase [Rhizobiales bacterium]|nr:indole acetimide hydrolase [Hyphomicrobiales bacterium]